jgi:hydroxymethylpyrimidine pyrophosphatase-like HAD family hydrolase
VFCLDVDGTIYVYERNKKGELTKRGLSKEAKRIIEERQIPIILNSGRPDWNDSSDEELEKLGLPRADVVIAGAGTIVYFRAPSGNLVVDEEFINIIKNQRIIYKQRIDDSFYPLSEENYNPHRLQTYLTKYLGDKFTPFCKKY